ncbi:MAG: cupin domain-containing protein [Candidatus Competibacter sp.]|nr:cupin domain-containing protein [Candidatus Competibacter sp.]MDG4585519.1 cupin domain-containing protein [Candidatus Competibacter sp.]
MNRNEAESLAGDYVLGALSGPELAEFETVLAADPVLRQQVSAWERRLTPLAATLPEATPRAALWDAIEAALDADGPPATVTVREREGEWRTLTPGLEIKLLLVDRQAGFQSFLLRLAPGCQLPAHDHDALEECLLLEGDMLIGDRAYTAGDYHAALPGSRHDPISTRNGGVVFLRSQLRPELCG